MNFFQKIGFAKADDSDLEYINETLKKYLSEIVTLRQIRQELLKTISDLRDENYRLKNELRDLKEL